MVALLAGLCGLLGGAGLILLMGTLSAFRPLNLADRIAPHLATVSAAAFDHALSVVHRRAGWRQGLVQVSTRAAARYSITDVLTRAGVTISGSRFVARCATSIACGAGVGCGAGVALLSCGAGISILISFTVVGAVVGALVPVMWLRLRLGRERRRITEELPIMLGFLHIAVSAGESLPRALDRVAGRGHGRLSDEFARVVDRMNLGEPMGDALRDLSRRVGLPAVDGAVATLMGALASGAPLAETLRDQVDALAESHEQRTIERASKQEVGMLVPVVFLILPVTVAFAIFPAVTALSLSF